MNIIRTNEWGARRAKQPPVWAARPARIIFHHTAGHHPEIQKTQNESRAEAIRYARDIQNFHMDTNGWNDSGHNFLVCRNGMILVGRHESYTSVKQGRMVVSAHCPGQNSQPGIEHEHLHEHGMTKEQLAASCELMVWIIRCCKMKDQSVIRPHREFFNTSCPAELMSLLPIVRSEVGRLLNV